MKNQTRNWFVGDRIYNNQDSIFNKTQTIKTIKIVGDITTVKFESNLWLQVKCGIPFDGENLDLTIRERNKND